MNKEKNYQEKISATEILASLWENRSEIESSYIPKEFFERYKDVLELCRMIANDWSRPTDNSQELIDYVWAVLCEMRELDPKNQYASLEEFFRMQSVDVDTSTNAGQELSNSNEFQNENDSKRAIIKQIKANLGISN
jgi:hypothetical protein